MLVRKYTRLEVASETELHWTMTIHNLQQEKNHILPQITPWDYTAVKKTSRKLKDKKVTNKTYK